MNKPELDRFKKPFVVDGWNDGSQDCDPPEPGKFWLSIVDADHSEVCTVVHRGEIYSDDNINEFTKEADEKLNRAFEICHLLNGPIVEARKDVNGEQLA